MRSAMSWPGMESIEHFRKGKALREEDVGELHLLHRLLHKAVLVEGDIGLLRLCPSAARCWSRTTGACCRRCCFVTPSGRWTFPDT